MYFKSRPDAGRLLAEKLDKYKNQQCAIVALTPGGVLVGAQIAMRLHTSLAILLSEKITLPGEQQPLAAISSNTFTYNNLFSAGQIEEFASEYHSIIESQRLEKFHKLNIVLMDGGEIDPATLRHHVVILVADALQNGLSLDLAADFLKSIKTKKLIIATPLATIAAVDRMHLVGDEIYCLNVAENLLDSDHYYDDNTIPDQQGIMKIVHNISLNWQR